MKKRSQSQSAKKRSQRAKKRSRQKSGSQRGGQFKSVPRPEQISTDTLAQEAAAFAQAYSKRMCLARDGHLVDRDTHECAVCMKPLTLILKDSDPYRLGETHLSH